VADGIKRALNEDPKPGQKRKLDGRAEAILIATACTEAPEGYTHWSLRLLAGNWCSWIVDTVIMRTVRKRSKKRTESPAQEMWQSRCLADAAIEEEGYTLDAPRMGRTGSPVAELSATLCATGTTPGAPYRATGTGLTAHNSQGSDSPQTVQAEPR
jgi:hypothetical protein